MLAFLTLIFTVIIVAVIEPGSKSFIGRLAQETLSDGGNADQRNVKVNKCLLGVSWLRFRGCLRLTRFFKRLIDLRDAKAEPSNRAVAEQAVPVPNFRIALVD